jgi:hypothetical protein
VDVSSFCDGKAALWEAALCVSPYLLRGIYRYIFTVVGSASLKLSVDSAGRIISFSPV